MALSTEQPEEQKLTKILIEVVVNGFIVHEDYDVNPRERIRSSAQQVFNPKKSLFNYISKTL